MTSVRINKPYTSPTVQDPTYPVVEDGTIKELPLEEERCKCGYKMPCAPTVPIGFCKQGL